MSRLFPLGLLLGMFVLVGCSRPNFSRPTIPVTSTTVPMEASSSALISPEGAFSAVIVSPLSNPKARITKKPFGLAVAPRASPVPLERFSGFHTGTDFEVTEAEQGEDVPVYVICTGFVRQARYASGYGGVVVQDCVIEGQAVTVIYGHLDLASVTATVGSELLIGERLALLGDVGPETDGERKHLHLGIHKGKEVDIRGYVPTESALSEWIDPMAALFPGKRTSFPFTM